MRETRWPVPKTVGLAVIIAAAALAVWSMGPEELPRTRSGALLVAAGAGVGFFAIGRLILRLGPAWLTLGTIATPMLVAVPIFQVPAWVFPIAVLVLAGFYVNGVTEKVPLYLSNSRTQQVISDFAPVTKGATFIDLGCGLGGVVAAVAKARPEAHVLGVETAPLSFAISWLRITLFGLTNAEVRFQSIWATDVSDADLVYAFLSPAPMTRLNEKLTAEMKPGSVFVSNSFAVPGREPDEIVAVDDQRQTQLLMWRM